jgi:DNA-binding NarL/FixJ family response regulator
MEVIGEATDGEAAVAQATQLNPDVVVLDVSMPWMNGLKATERIRVCCPAVKVLTLTRHSDDRSLQQLLRAGVSGYVSKQSRAIELLQAIRAVAAGGKYLDSTVASRVINEFGRRSQTVASSLSERTPREEQVLRLVAWGYSNKEIAAQLDVSVKTVETHKTKAMQRLGLHSRIDIVRFALLHGWLEDV